MATESLQDSQLIAVPIPGQVVYNPQHRVPALIGWGKGGNVTSAGWQVIIV